MITATWENTALGSLGRPLTCTEQLLISMEINWANLSRALTSGFYFSGQNWADAIWGSGQFWAELGPPLTCTDQNWAVLNMILPHASGHPRPGARRAPGAQERVRGDHKIDNGEGTRS